jgi:tetratricopeptide (TPR) repeat protein
MAVALRSVPEWATTQGLAASAAARRHHHLAEARFLSQQARAFADGGEHDRAAEASAAALAAARLSADEQMLASVTEFTGVCQLEAGDAEPALVAFDRARRVFERLGVTRGVALQDYYASRALLHLDRPEEALVRAGAAFDVLVMAKDEVSVARAQLRRAEAHLALGRSADAEAAADSARVTASTNGNHFEEAQAHDLLAKCAAGNPESVAAHHAAARAAYRLIGHPNGAE